ncbi:flavohemoprotein [Vibrio sp. JCM 19236]|nr:flavohemoprotein [Vibrio sp. JCM 19236]
MPPRWQVHPHLLSAVSSGDRLYISEAKGDFYPRTDNSPLLLIAGGTGITPFASFLDQQVKRDTPVTLLHFAPTSDDHLFSQHFTELSQQHPHFRYLPISTREHGYLSREILRQNLSENEDDHVMVCGPDELMKQARKLALAAGINAENFKTEAFSLSLGNLESGAAQAVPAISVSQNGTSNKYSQIKPIRY